MASNVRMKIAAGATVLGLGGLAGYALASNDGQSAAAGQAARELQPKVHTEVVHRTIHVRAKGRAEEDAAGGSPSAGSGTSLSSYESDDHDADESDDHGAYESDDGDEHGEHESDGHDRHESGEHDEHESEGGDD